VPSIVSWPSHLPAGCDFADLGVMMDVLPTILEAVDGGPAGSGTAEEDQNRGIDGRSLLQAWTHEPRDDAPKQAEPVFWSYEGQWAVRRAQLKLVVSAREGMVPPIVVDGALYDLSSDPTETTDVAELFPAELAQLRADLADFQGLHASWTQSVGGSADHDSSRHAVGALVRSEVEGAGSAA